jgi:hypothetical protein
MEKIKTIEDCNTAANELSCEAETVLANMDASMKEILYAAGWAVQDTDSFCLIGLLPRIIRATMSLYQELYLVFQRLAVAHPNQWEAVGLEYVTHHAKAFARIRKCSQTRSQMILQNYTYLRDAKTKNFTDMKLLGALSLKWHSMAMAGTPAAPTKSSAPVKALPAPPPWSCSHCHTADLHEGGARKCIARDLPILKARRLALESLKVHKTEPGAFERLVTEELTKG